MSRVGCYEIRRVDEHFEIWLGDKRVSSVDTIDEAYKDIDEEENK